MAQSDRPNSLDNMEVSSVVEIQNSMFQAYGKVIENCDEAHQFVGDLLSSSI